MRVVRPADVRRAKATKELQGLIADIDELKKKIRSLEQQIEEIKTAGNQHKIAIDLTGDKE